ncbi:hypothetical protein TrCOL_g10112 [Triparma columacea]|uniref:Uncharacterized protein n=1 Tax=Triparma columacea TaxID=722753 RepID=A0A9W7GB93_9STRA|nr:hypothetical protein TrCOL_g10112 [Triparma columacea]
MPSSAKYNHLWPIFFVLAGVSNLIQAWAFYYSEIPSISAAAILHLKPDMLSAISKGFCGYYPKRVLPPGSIITGDLLPRSGAEFFACNGIPAFLRENPVYAEGWEMAVWQSVAIAGACYLAHGITACRFINADFIFVFGLLKLQTAATLGFVWSRGSDFRGGDFEGGLLGEIAISEVAWGVLFMTWWFTRSSGGVDDMEEKKKKKSD